MVTIEKDEHGLDRIVLRGPEKSSATVYLHGAHVTSWTSPEGNELLFVSEKAVFKPPKAIRGGIPICFPQFGDMGPLKQQHGFARTRAFELEAASASGDQATLLLKHDGQSDDFEHPFELRVTVRVADGGKQLVQTLSVKNVAEAGTAAAAAPPMTFTAALHTYFLVPDISRARVLGLKGTKYLDSLDGRKEKEEQGDDGVRFGEEVDRIYASVPSDGSVRVVVGDDDSKETPSSSSSSSSSYSISIETVNLPDAVVWNPWVDKSKAMADFGDEEYRRMLCVEPAATLASSPKKPAEVAAGGAEWVAVQKLKLVS